MLKQYVQRGMITTALLSFGIIFPRIISFIVLPFFLSHIQLEDFGIWEFYQTFSTLALLIISSCATISLSRFYILYKDDVHKQSASVGNTLLMIIALMGACALILFMTIKLRIITNEFSILTVCNALTYAPFSLILAYLRVRDFLRLHVLFVVAQHLISTALAFIGVMYGYGVYSFFYAASLSTLLYFPFFIRLCMRYWNFSYEIIVLQLAMSFPLLLYNLIYSFCSHADRLAIKYGMGFEILGEYSLLLRFGTMFQFFCMALLDAAPLILFHAHKEERGSELVQKLTFYSIIMVCTVGLYSVIGTYYTIVYWFGAEYTYLAIYAPIFFFPLVILQSGRLIQTVFSLENTTWMVPVISLITSIIQVIGLYSTASSGMIGICCANGIAFLVYCVLSYIFGRGVSRDYSINGKRCVYLLHLFIVCLAILYGIFVYSYAWYWTMIVALSWPIALWIFKIF